MKYSIIIPCFNGLDHIVPCLASIQRHTSNFELILVDDCSTDGTAEFLRHYATSNQNVHVMLHNKNLGFSESVNSGIAAAQCPFIILLNSDTLVTPDWADSLHATFAKAEKEFSIDKVGAVGPVSNYAGGDQGIQFDKYNLDQLDQACLEHRQTYRDRIQITGFLSGFCIMIRRSLIEKIGLFDTRFKIAFWEDNDFSLRAQLAGWHLIIDQSTFIHHHGSGTLRTLKIDANYLLRSNQMRFFEKYYDESPKKLIATCRSHNAANDLKQSLERASEFSDEIIVLLDRCTDNSYEIAKSFPKVQRIIQINEGFNEARDRQLLLDSAHELGADWIFSFDSDEIIEKSFTYNYAHKLMNPLDPQILGYGLNFRTFFLGNTHFRTDGTFGQLWGVRFWRCWPGQKIQSGGHQGLHCTHCPPIPRFNIRRIRPRIKHYGYNTPEKCSVKHKFYTKKDADPDLRKTSPIGYDHIISDSIAVNRWREKNDITLCMIAANEETNLFGFLARYYAYFDDIVIVDTGSKDFTPQIPKLFGARYFKHRWKNSFSEARNFGIEQCSTRWILSMDPDEEIFEKDLSTLYDMIEENVHAWLFKVLNFQKDGTAAYSDNVRLFRNVPQLRWAWRVHENMAPAITKHKFICLPAPFIIRHYGYLKAESSRSRKLIQYSHLLKKQIKEFPKEAISFFHLAFHEFEDGNHYKGMELLKKAVKLKPEFFLAHKELGLRYLKTAQDHIEKAATNTPQTHYYHGWINHLKNSIEELLARPLEE